MAKSDQASSIKVDGAKELRRSIKKMESKDLKDNLKAANKEAAEVVSERAKTSTVPVDSGNLRKAIRALGSQSKGQVKVGGARGNTRDYAGVVHYGDRNRGIEPQPFLHEAASDKWEEVRAAYEKAMNDIAGKLSSRSL